MKVMMYVSIHDAGISRASPSRDCAGTGFDSELGGIGLSGNWLNVVQCA